MSVTFTKLEPLQGREVFFTATVGSHMFSLQTEESDVDLVSYVFPTFHDLVEGVSISTHDITEKIDRVTYDVRRLPELISNSNLNQLLPFFSHDIVVNEKWKGEFETLLSLREKMAACNSELLYNSTVGMLGRITKRKYMQADPHKAQLKDKELTIRYIDLLDSFSSGGFTSFESSLKQLDIPFLKRVKLGLLEEDELNELLAKKRERLMLIKGKFLTTLEKLKGQQKPQTIPILLDTQLEAELSNFTKELVFEKYNQPL